MNILIISMILSITEARSVRRPTFQMYSKSTGRHLTIGSKVGSTRKTNSPTGTVKLVNVGDNQFMFQGVLTGLYVAQPKNRSTRVRTTASVEKAAKFTEQIVENYFNQYKLANNENCALTIRNSGTVRITCKKINSKSTSFLPRRVHTRKAMLLGKHL